MRKLLPASDGSHRPVGLEQLYAGLTLAAPTRSDRARVAVGMVSSVDGAAARDGRTRELGGAADRQAFGRLRAACDAVLVGAGTVRAENYRPPTGTAARRTDRTARGLAAVPTLVIVSGTLDLDVHHRVFSDPSHRPVLLTHEASPSTRREALAKVADLLVLGCDEVDLEAGLRWLAAHGLGRVLCEGGPTLNGAMFAADLVDEVFLTLAPIAIGGAAPRIVTSSEQTGRDLELVQLHAHEHEVMLHYRVRR